MIMTDIQKNEIASLVMGEKTHLGSLSRVATKCGVSEATISHILNGKWETITDKMWTKIAHIVDWKPEGWQIVDTTNTKILHNVFTSAKRKSLFVAVSHRAGSGKTASSKAYASTTEDVFYLQCREWSRKDFLTKFCQIAGIDPGRGYFNADQIIEKIVTYFQQRASRKPLVIIDEADKLKPAALRSLIPLYNECEGIVGLVILGTDNLEKEVKRGVKYDKKGYDELDSRFGRNFIHLVGATMTDVRKICQANGIDDRQLQHEIFSECEPSKEMVDGRLLSVVSDLRRVKRAVMREQLRLAVH